MLRAACCHVPPSVLPRFVLPWSFADCRARINRVGELPRGFVRGGARKWASARATSSVAAGGRARRADCAMRGSEASPPPACAGASERRRWSWQGASARAHRAWRGPRSEATRGEAGQYVWSDRGGEVDGGEGLSPAALRCPSRDAELREQVRVSGPYELLLDPVVVGAAGAAVHVVSRARTGASASARVESEKSECFRLARLHRDGYRMFSAVAGSRSSRPTRSAASSSLRTRASPSASKLPWASRSPATSSCSKSPRSSCTKCRP